MTTEANRVIYVWMSVSVHTCESWWFASCVLVVWSKYTSRLWESFSLFSFFIVLCMWPAAFQHTSPLCDITGAECVFTERLWPSEGGFSPFGLVATFLRPRGFSSNGENGGCEASPAVYEQMRKKTWEWNVTIHAETEKECRCSKRASVVTASQSGLNMAYLWHLLHTHCSSLCFIHSFLSFFLSLCA